MKMLSLIGVCILAVTCTVQADDCLTMKVSALTAGKDATWEVSGITPNVRVVVTFGFTPGTTEFKDAGGYCATFGFKFVTKRRVICQKTADANGTISCTKFMPGISTGWRVLTQAAERFTCPFECMSNLDDQVVQ